MEKFGKIPLLMNSGRYKRGLRRGSGSILDP